MKKLVLFLALIVLASCPVVASADVPLIGGYIEIDGNIYTPGDWLGQWDLEAGSTLEFVPIPANATIHSVEWYSYYIPLTNTDQLETQVSDEYPGGDILTQDTYIYLRINDRPYGEIMIWVESTK